MFMMHIWDQRVVLISANLVNIVVCSHGMCGVEQIAPWELNILAFDVTFIYIICYGMS